MTILLDQHCFETHSAICEFVFYAEKPAQPDEEEQVCKYFQLYPGNASEIKNCSP